MIVRNLKYRVVIIVLTILVLYGIVLKLISGRKFDVSLEKIKIPLQGSAYIELNTETCIFPKISSNIEDLQWLFQTSPPLTCKYKEMDWVTCQKSKCYVKKSILLKEQDIKCTFIDVMFNTDFGIYDGALQSGATIYTLNKSDVVKVYCKSKANSWSSVLVGIRDEVNKTTSNYHNPMSTATNVLIIGFPSVSRNTFIQKLPLTYRYLVKVFKGIVLKGYNTAEKGTLSSLYPMLTGKFQKDLVSSNPFLWKENKNIDNRDFIWKDYQRKGYVTAFLEDFNLWAPLEEKLEGFQLMPTDHYIKPYYLAASDRFRVWSKYCSGSVPRYKLFMDYIKAFFSTYKERKKFLFAFQGELTYNNYNALDQMDEEMLSFFRHLQTSNDLENTLLIIMSDQGYKFSTIKDTLLTKLEENLPFVYVRLPPELIKTRRYMYDNLKRNAFALTTPFDLHTTLKHLLYRYHMEADNSFSLFSKFSKERSCSDAHIQPDSCACLTKTGIDLKSPIVPRLKKLLEDTMNNITFYLRDTCVELSVFSVTNLTRVVPNKSLSRYTTNKEHYTLVAIMIPSYTVYEAVFLRNLTTDEITLTPSDIISHDFGLQSWCIKNSYPRLRKFCYCVNQSL